MKRIFLSAEWRYLAMINYEIDPAVIRPLVPPGTEIDFFNGKTYASVVGFRFLKTKVLGMPIPFHSNFEEVNLRFYVRRCGPEGWRRGVAFVRELVPRCAIAWVARTVYGEPYRALPMGHQITETPTAIDVVYRWKRKGQWESLGVQGQGQAQPLLGGSQEEFIAEHYWGYTQRANGCSEYQVEHPPWRVWRGTKSFLHADIRGLYGEPFVEALSASPASSMIAEGSPIVVRRKTDLR